MKLLKLGLISSFCLLLLYACGGGKNAGNDQDTTAKTDSTTAIDTSAKTTKNNEITAADKVFVMPIRKIKEGVSIEDFKAKRDAYVALLEKQSGTVADREIQPFFEFTGSKLNLKRVFVGLTSFKDMTTFKKIGETTQNSPEAKAFFEAFDFISFQVLKPLKENEKVDLKDFANLGTNQVWEVAVRDLSKYTDFEKADYEAKRDAYLKVLAAQSNFVREVQWISASDPNIVVGMTIYKDAKSYQEVNADKKFIDEYKATGFVQKYPINVYGAIHNVLK